MKTQEFNFGEYLVEDGPVTIDKIVLLNYSGKQYIKCVLIGGVWFEEYIDSYTGCFTYVLLKSDDLLERLKDVQ